MPSIRSMARDIARSEQAPQQTAWPEGVIARYLTVAGATVDLTGGGDYTRTRCTGCGDGGAPGLWWNERRANELAQGHAEKCRALPKPTA
jgi:hypothetical protein